METILISMVAWLVINLITWLSWKLNLSKTYVSVGLSILLWVILYVGQIVVKKYPLAREQIVGFAGGAYAMSQMCYNLYQKYIEKKGE